MIWKSTPVRSIRASRGRQGGARPQHSPCLQDRSQITLKEISERHPLAHGLAELVAYLQLGSDQFKAVIDEATPEIISWTAASMQNSLPSAAAPACPGLFLSDRNLE
jgi:hypothetical protein